MSATMCRTSIVRRQVCQMNVVDHTTCLGLTIDNCLSWSKHICHIKKHFSQKVGALKRMRQLPPKVLEEIYFKSIIPAVIYGIVVWGNCSSAMLNSLTLIHERADRLIHDQDGLGLGLAYCCLCSMLSKIMFLTTLHPYLL